MRRTVYLICGIFLAIGMIGLGKQAFESVDAGESVGDFQFLRQDIRGAKDFLASLVHAAGATWNEKDLIGTVGPVFLSPDMTPLRVEMFTAHEVPLGDALPVPLVELVLFDSAGSPVWKYSQGTGAEGGQGWQKGPATARSKSPLAEYEQMRFPRFSVPKPDTYRLWVRLDPRVVRSVKTDISFGFISKPPEPNSAQLAFFGSFFVVGVLGCLLTRDKRWYRR